MFDLYLLLTFCCVALDLRCMCWLLASVLPCICFCFCLCVLCVAACVVVLCVCFVSAALCVVNFNWFYVFFSRVLCVLLCFVVDVHLICVCLLVAL